MRIARASVAGSWLPRAPFISSSGVADSASVGLRGVRPGGSPREEMSGSGRGPLRFRSRRSSGVPANLLRDAFGLFNRLRALIRASAAVRVRRISVLRQRRKHVIKLVSEDVRAPTSLRLHPGPAQAFLHRGSLPLPPTNPQHRLLAPPSAAPRAEVRARMRLPDPPGRGAPPAA